MDWNVYRLICAMIMLSFLATSCAYTADATEPDRVTIQLQERLSALGYDVGDIDGMWDPVVKAALERFQQVQSLAVTGRLNSITASKLGIELPVAYPKDIVELLVADKVEVKSEGRGIQKVEIKLHTKVPYDLQASIPVGTVFVANNRASQNMVTTEEKVVKLDVDDWVSELIDAACGNMRKNIPGAKDTFTVRRSSERNELQRLLHALDSVGASYPVRQAAIWIVTDNAGYSDLGILVARPHFQSFGGSRVIGPSEAAIAMKICDQAGIDITRKAIWRDRKMILESIPESSLKMWLENK